jgi:hypothetical protein
MTSARPEEDEQGAAGRRSVGHAPPEGARSSRRTSGSTEIEQPRKTTSRSHATARRARRGGGQARAQGRRPGARTQSSAGVGATARSWRRLGQWLRRAEKKDWLYTILETLTLH